MKEKELGIEEHQYYELIKEIKIKAKLLMSDYFEVECERYSRLYTHLEFQNNKCGINVVLTFLTTYKENANARIESSKYRGGKKDIKLNFYSLENDGDTLLQNLQKIKMNLILKSIFGNI